MYFKGIWVSSYDSEPSPGPNLQHSLPRTLNQTDRSPQCKQPQSPQLRVKELPRRCLRCWSSTAWHRELTEAARVTAQALRLISLESCGPELLVSDRGQSALNTHLYFSLTTQASFLQAQKRAFWSFKTGTRQRARSHHAPPECMSAWIHFSCPHSLFLWFFLTLSRVQLFHKLLPKPDLGRESARNLSQTSEFTSMWDLIWNLTCLDMKVCTTT